MVGASADFAGHVLEIAEGVALARKTLMKEAKRAVLTKSAVAFNIVGSIFDAICFSMEAYKEFEKVASEGAEQETCGLVLLHRSIRTTSTAPP